MCGLRKEIHQFNIERCALTAESSSPLNFNVAEKK